VGVLCASVCRIGNTDMNARELEGERADGTFCASLDLPFPSELLEATTSALPLRFAAAESLAAAAGGFLATGISEGLQFLGF
jgi:hypothetical protein